MRGVDVGYLIGIIVGGLIGFLTLLGFIISVIKRRKEILHAGDAGKIFTHNETKIEEVFNDYDGKLILTTRRFLYSSDNEDEIFLELEPKDILRFGVGERGLTKNSVKPTIILVYKDNEDNSITKTWAIPSQREVLGKEKKNPHSAITFHEALLNWKAKNDGISSN